MSEEQIHESKIIKLGGGLGIFGGGGGFVSPASRS